MENKNNKYKEYAHHVFHGGGDIVIIRETHSSFHKPSLLEPLALNKYTPGGTLVYFARRLLSLYIQSLSKPSSMKAYSFLRGLI